VQTRGMDCRALNWEGENTELLLVIGRKGGEAKKPVHQTQRGKQESLNENKHWGGGGLAEVGHKSGGRQAEGM